MSSDSQARQTALSATESFIVQAPAGSGKTGLLVYRLMTLLASVEHPQQVLAITFTRKATAELRERVLTLLREAEQGVDGKDPFHAQGLRLARAVLAQDARLGWRLSDAPHQMQILTIDAFCARLVGSMPWLSRLGDRPRTADHADVHYAAAVEQLLGELLEHDTPLANSLKTVMMALDFNYAKARELFSSMLAKRDQWLRHLAQHELALARVDLEQSWAAIVDQQLQQIKRLLPMEMRQSLFESGAQAAINVGAEQGADSSLHQLSEWSWEREPDLAQWKALCNLVLTASGTVRKTVNKKLGFLPGTPLTQQFKELLANLSDDAQIAPALCEIRDLPDAQFSDADWSQMLALEQVLKALAALLQLQFRAAGECDHNEVMQRANLALQELENPTDLGLRLDHQIQHILVDEFQDTSHGQVELLRKLTTGWQSGDGRTLFLVGDPMQSIYRFREADVGLFTQVANNAETGIFDNIHIQALRLSENFRSSKALVNWFNHTFKASFPASNNELIGAIEYAPATCANDDVAPAVEYRMASDRSQDTGVLIEAVQHAVADLPDDGSQVAILVRSRTILDEILPALDAAQIDYHGIDIRPLKDLQAVIDVLALCKSLCREDDRVAWLSLLRGPWCGLSLEQLKRVAGVQDRSVWQQISEFDVNQLPADAAQRLLRFRDCLTRAWQQRQQVSLGALTRWTWRHLGGDSTLLDASQEDLQTVFDLIDESQRGGDLLSVKDLQRSLSGLYAKPSATNARVVVSTMHKSKGLQFHTVILPGLANSPRHLDKEVMMWSEYQDSEGSTRLLLAPFTLEDQVGGHYQYLRYLEKQRGEHETIRLMYVACTRAERRLWLLGRVKLDDKTGAVRRPVRNTLLATVWETLASQFEQHINLDEVEQAHDRAFNQQLERLPAGSPIEFAPAIEWQVQQQLNTQPLVPENVVEYEWATEVATGVGIVLHEWLQYQAENVLDIEVTEPLKKQWRAELAALRVPADRINAAVARLIRAVDNIKRDSDRHFLFARHETAHNELALSAYEDGRVNHYRIDRTFVDQDGVRWIVDYKTTDTNASDVDAFVDEQVATRHRAQLQKYGELMSQIDTNPIRLAIYFPLLNQFRSWQYQPDSPTQTIRSSE